MILLLDEEDQGFNVVLDEDYFLIQNHTAYLQVPMCIDNHYSNELK